jgi:aspartate dehydrogenase
MSAPKRVLVIGYGAIGRALEKRLNAMGGFEIAVWVRESREYDGPLRTVASYEQALMSGPALAVECAGQDAVRTLAPLLLADDIPVLIASVGALADASVHDALRLASRGRVRARVILPSGAIGGLDYLDAVANEPGLEVGYTSTKPVAAWRGELLRRGIDADALCAPYTLFDGSAAEAALRYPQNLNVAATLALHGVGMKKTRVTVRADPAASANMHEIQVRSTAGCASFRFENQPSADNPKTSALTALSLAAEVARFFRETPA